MFAFCSFGRKGGQAGWLKGRSYIHGPGTQVMDHPATPDTYTHTTSTGHAPSSSSSSSPGPPPLALEVDEPLEWLEDQGVGGVVFGL